MVMLAGDSDGAAAAPVMMGCPNASLADEISQLGSVIGQVQFYNHAALLTNLAPLIGLKNYLSQRDDARTLFTPHSTVN